MSLIGKTRESTTLQLLLVPLALISWNYLNTEATSVTEYAQAYAVLLAVWLGREWRSSHYANKD